MRGEKSMDEKKTISANHFGNLIRMSKTSWLFIATYISTTKASVTIRCYVDHMVVLQWFISNQLSHHCLVYHGSYNPLQFDYDGHALEFGYGYATNWANSPKQFILVIKIVPMRGLVDAQEYKLVLLKITTWYTLLTP